MNNKPSSSLSNNSDNKIENKKKHFKKVVRRRTKRDGSTLSSNSSNMITSYRTTKVVQQTLNTPTITPNKNNYETSKCELSDDHNEECEEVSFRDNHEENETNLKLECDSDFDFQKLENKMEERKQKFLETKKMESPSKIKLQKLSKIHNKKEIMKMFDHIDSEIIFSKFNNENKEIYLEDEDERIWLIKKVETISPRSLKSLPSLKSVDSPMSIENGDFKLSPNSKNKTAIHDFKKFSIDINNEEDKELGKYSKI